jgi:branched-chain amino acid aminotransferase
VIDLAGKRGYKVVERALMPEELKKTQEVFITGTAAEVTPIKEIGDLKFKPGEITRKLMQDYDALVRGQQAAAAKAAE